MLVGLSSAGVGTSTARWSGPKGCSSRCPRVGPIRAGCVSMVVCCVGGTTRMARRMRPTGCSSRCPRAGTIRVRCVSIGVWSVGGTTRMAGRMRPTGSSPRCPPAGGSRAGCASTPRSPVGVAPTSSLTPLAGFCGFDDRRHGRADPAAFASAAVGGTSGGDGAGIAPPAGGRKSVHVGEWGSVAVPPGACRGPVRGGCVGVGGRGVRFGRWCGRCGGGGGVRGGVVGGRSCCR